MTMTNAAADIVTQIMGVVRAICSYQSEELAKCSSDHVLICNSLSAETMDAEHTIASLSSPQDGVWSVQ